jgi:hypothetical protein
MKRLIPTLFVLAACGGDNRSPAEEEAIAICGTYCEECNASQEEEDKQRCSQVCFDQWAILGESHNIEKRDCAAGILVGRECQAERGCNAPACGDPFADFRRCMDLIGDDEP